MTKLGRRFFLVGALVLTASGGSAGFANPAPGDAAMIERIDRVAKSAVEQKRTPGIAVAVSRNGKLVYACAFGTADLESGAPVTVDTVFRIGSITKEFTAAAIVQLAERGMLKYDDSLSRYFPDFPGGDKVTIRHLLNHTSGIHDFVAAKDFASRETRLFRTTADMLAFIKSAEPLYDFTPGTAWSYSNSGYRLLGAIVEKVSGGSLQAYLKANFFDPLGMRNTALDDEREVVPNRANGYVPDPKAPSGFRNADFVSMSVPGSAGGGRSTVGDLLRWHDALLAGRIVSARSVKEMMTPGRVADGRTVSQAHAKTYHGPNFGTEYGFGLMMGQVAGYRHVGHPGGIDGFFADLKSFPAEHVTTVTLTNVDWMANPVPIAAAVSMIALGEKPASAAASQ